VEPLDEPRQVITRFNDCISAGELGGLALLMTADHVFTDSAGESWRGREECLRTWAGFFEAFPGYRNSFTATETRNELVVLCGYSVCAEPALEGPALWSATVRGGRVAEWRVYDDTVQARTELGLT
jgi:ketosteroid isomerase-like protein